ncbi:MAG TPA: cytochrome c-type biogenesis protein CcmH [Rhodobacteraceae bacterium]|nr:cytochrome c-type biogenesis protein CcmH [Paracoccaceae bacterium]
MKKLLGILACTLTLMFMAPASYAVEPDEVLSDPKLEKRARDISAGLRCLVCQNQSIDDSNADLAKDLRVLVRERLKKGETDEQVTNYIVDRYGEFVLLRPRFEPRTYVIWFSPVIILLLGAGGLFAAWRRKKAAAATAVGVKALSDEEKQRLDKLLVSGE